MGWSFSAQHPGSPVRAEKERMVLIGVYASPCGMGKVWGSNSLIPSQHSGLVTKSQEYHCTTLERVIAIFENELCFRADLSFWVICN